MKLWIGIKVNRLKSDNIDWMNGIIKWWDGIGKELSDSCVRLMN